MLHKLPVIGLAQLRIRNWVFNYQLCRKTDLYGYFFTSHSFDLHVWENDSSNMVVEFLRS